MNSAGPETGPFNLYSNVDGYMSAFAVSVPKDELIAGKYFTVPDGTVLVRIMSVGICYRYEDFLLVGASTTTSTTTLFPVDWFWYGTLEDVGAFSEIPSPDDIYPLTGTYVPTGASDPMVIPFNSGVADYLWFAVPANIPIKTEWYVLDMNKGDIGGPASRFGNLFSAPYPIVINDVPHYLYVSTVRTNVSSMTIT